MTAGFFDIMYAITMKKLFLTIFALIQLIGVASVSADEIPDSKTYLSEITKQLQIKWPKNRTINIVCHGHSVPSGYFKTPLVDTFNAYPHLLHKALKKKHPYAVINVIVTGIGGETSVRGVKRFETEVLNHKPDIVLIDYALNDMNKGLPAAKKAWTEIITKAKKQGCKVILLTPTAETKTNFDDANSEISKHAQQIRDLAKEHNVALADSFEAFKHYVKSNKPIKDLMSQVNHPNRNGHDLVVAELLKWF